MQRLSRELELEAIRLLTKEISRVEHSIERYHDAFETGDLSPTRFNERLSSLDARLDSLRGQDQGTRRRRTHDT